jgi:hypothetical protein
VAFILDRPFDLLFDRIDVHYSPPADRTAPVASPAPPA